MRASADGQLSDAAKAEFFETKVRPVLVEKCFGCHGPEKQKAHLRLDSADTMRAGGDSGPAIVPGDPDQSLVIEAVRQTGELRMPPKDKLKDAEIESLTEWIKGGAHWPTAPGEVRSVANSGAKEITDADRAFWSFQPIKDAPLPAIRNVTWPQGPIDVFILAKLQEKNLAPSPPADRRTWIRRVTFDLIGLPPTPQEVDAFLNDFSSDAFGKVVDRLLASPQYGERWGRQWLDIARSGEDQAHSFKPRLYPNGFRYRDWVVSALNSDKPYDRFIIEQVAGDLLDEPGRLERLPALGFFALGPVYYGDSKQFDQIDDRIDTMSRGFLGLTVACARCHDHKYDPIPSSDYYGLAGVFASSEYEQAPFTSREQVEAYEAGQKVVKEKTNEIDAFLKTESDRLAESRTSEIAQYVVAVWKLKAEQPAGGEPPVDAVATREKLDPKRLKRWFTYFDAASKKKEPPAPLSYVLELLSRKPQESEVPCETSLEADVTMAAELLQDQIQSLVTRRTSRSENAKDGGATVSKPAERENSAKALLDELFGEKGVMGTPKDRLEKDLPEPSRVKLASMRSAMEQLKKTVPPMYPVTHTLKDRATPAKMHLLVRGNPETPGPEVTRHFLSILGGDHASFTDGSGRIELARAIASPENPLTARVLVNRVWQHHFGRGLVGTPSNFGSLGERPSHPELLDHLARTFIDGGWSLKALHRAIVLSATYRQSSRFVAAAHDVDPENRLLWRMNRRRLEVEAWRDAMLAVADRLDPTFGGPSLKLEDLENRRRTFYAAVSRHDLSPLLRLFDFPDPNITSAERTQTTVALQQLLVLNSELLIENAKAFERALRTQGGDDSSRIHRAYQQLYGRPATEAEVRAGLSYVRGSDSSGATAPDLTRWQRYAQVLLAANEFAFVD
jgi:hypothetical protein